MVALHAFIVDFTGFFEKCVNFIKRYIFLESVQKGEQILQIKKVIKGR
ncbi:hypothetical protein SSUR61_1554 [Streptococcus suis R61]|uniref:Uncharacterized protein n=1 Tax=Streptococcus suis R61 TaxID=996306 RepID=A0AA87F7N0_STRSU|nr:hypothetical protein [Streptococcus phage phiJH1301-3]EHC02140.1 hypothetical protein SSUR61_1554 [Streptococcus suis R61]